MGSRSLSYADAARLLGASEHPLIRIFGAASGAVTAAATMGTLADVDFFALRGELIRWGNTVVTGLQERMTGVGRLDRTQRLEAAHAIVVVTSFYEALEAALAGRPGVDLAAARMTAGEQVAVVTSTAVTARYGELVQVLIDTPPPMPAPHRPFEKTLWDLAEYFGSASTAVQNFLAGLVAFEDGRDEIVAAVEGQVRRMAVRRYTEAYRALSVQAPEFGVWAGMVEAQATRTVLHDALIDLSARLDELRSLSGAGAVDAVLAGLGKRYRAGLDSAILASAHAPAHVVLPSLDDGYVNPHGRVAVAGPADLPATESWWNDAVAVEDVHGFLLAHLVTPGAVARPLVVLGQPGSGKSALTRILAARLPPADFLVVRVELRNVPADSSIQAQIEQALLQMLGEHVSWPDLARRAGAALPVVVLDGFDELLQATGMNRADYLEQIRLFQQRERELDRPVAVLVTSRTVVADRARFPRDTVVLRLEPFNETQVRTWLDVWNAHNAAGLAARGLRQLPVGTALAHGELASQPLLLLLLALYDAGANALQSADGGLHRVDLYERLFSDFVEREVDKDRQGRSDDQRADEINAEWRRLGAVAVATLNRGGDVILEAELNADLPHLLSDTDLRPARDGSANRALTAGQLMVGRFFFIHESRATRDTAGPERSFEFLHATFGEFLAARQIVAELLDLAEERVHQRRRRGVIDPGPLHAATSFVTITRRAPLWELCREMLTRLSPRQRALCRELALELLADAGYAHPTWTRRDYEPRRIPLAARHAAFSANLVCFVVLVNDGPVDAAELVGEPVVVNWRRQALLWQSQLDPEDRKRMWQTLRVAWRLDTDPTRLEVRVEDGADISVYESLPWPPELRPVTRKPGALARGMAPDVSVRGESRMGRSLRRSAFVQTAHEVRECLYDLMPYWQHAGTPGLHLIDDEPVLVSEAALFLQLLLAPAAEQPRDLRAKQYEWALTLTSLPRQRDLLIRQLGEEAPRFSDANLHRILSSVTADDVERNQSTLADMLTTVTVRAPDRRELAGSLMGAIRWDLADRRDNPAREQLALLVMGDPGAPA
ncbi:NACHT domain-containing protein [Actinoplanes sp. NPDC048967]|uniref:NACHT domain-containing protein n=1 Tax=Actinoplanes sp. NPDC048967 TaxID=3155269 RepID=UPI0033F9DF10